MHMARAVDCPSVIVYGGRLRPDQIGYICNENLYNAVECSPCWLDTRCDFGRVLPGHRSRRGAVIEAAERMLARPRERPRRRVLRDQLATRRAARPTDSRPRSTGTVPELDVPACEREPMECERLCLGPSRRRYHRGDLPVLRPQGGDRRRPDALDRRPRTEDAGDAGGSSSITEYPDLYRGNTDFDGVATRGSRLSRLLVKPRQRSPDGLTYLINYNPLTEERDPPPEPVLAYLCRMVGVTGRIDLRPYINLTGPERAWGTPYRGCIAVQSSDAGAGSHYPNKEWFPERFAEVAAAPDPVAPRRPDRRPRRPRRPLHTRPPRQDLAPPARRPCWPAAACTSAWRACPCTWPAPLTAPRSSSTAAASGPTRSGTSATRTSTMPSSARPAGWTRGATSAGYCLDTITAGAVIEAAERMLARPRERLAVESYEIIEGAIPVAPAAQGAASP